MNTYTFTLNNNNTSRNPFYNGNKSTNYSKILDDLIFDDIISKNKWLNGIKKEDPIINGMIDSAKNKSFNITLNADSDFIKASNFLANYGENNMFKPYKKGEIYELPDGTLFTIDDDYIHIGQKMYFFNQFNDLSFLNELSTHEKKTICTIYTDSLKITIKK